MSPSFQRYFTVLKVFIACYMTGKLAWNKVFILDWEIWMQLTEENIYHIGWIQLRNFHISKSKDLFMTKFVFFAWDPATFNWENWSILRRLLKFSLGISKRLFFQSEKLLNIVLLMKCLFQFKKQMNNSITSYSL